jgi:arylsulfatase A-like enzyme
MQSEGPNPLKLSEQRKKVTAVSDSSKRSARKISRREMLVATAMAIPAVALESCNDGTKSNSGGAAQPKNVILFMTDQERATQHFPQGWEAANLPGMSRLKKNGLTFNRAYTNACMCSPARSTLMTGFFPAQHGVKYTTEMGMQPLSDYPDQFSLPFPPGTADLTPPPNSTSIAADDAGKPNGAVLTLPNIASVATACGFHAVYKGKWHCAKPLNAGGTWSPADLSQYGFSRWNCPDAGANQEVSEAGGAPTASTSLQNHDKRYMFDDGDVATGHEGILAYLKTQAKAQQPFFLVISIVNPHDVLAYPTNFSAFGYDDTWLQGDIELPETVNEDLSSKPSVQKQFLQIFDHSSPLTSNDERRNYLNFYANLMKLQDTYLVNVLETLDSLGLTDDTLIIRTSDHGEMGLAHGGLRQKNFNFYEESTRVPLVYSNPKLFPSARTSDALVSHVDLLPTLAGLYNYQKTSTGSQNPLTCQGVDYSKLILDANAQPVQDYIVFTYDDYQSGQASNIYPLPPNHVVAILQSRWKLAEYYAPGGKIPSQYEMYDLQTDPLEQSNLANNLSDPTISAQFSTLQSALEQVKTTRLKPLQGGYYLTSFS